MEDEEGTRLTMEEIAQRAGVTRKTLYTWRTDNDSFRELVNDLAEKSMDGFIHEVYYALRHRVKIDRSDKAIELALKRGGKLKDVSDARITVQDERDSAAVAEEIEALRKELSDG